MKNNTTPEKSSLHPRNKHRSRYDFEVLLLKTPELKSFIYTNEHEIETIDFSNPLAVKTLNKALLKSYYGILDWDLPEDYLCPPIPGRADYIHHIADLLAEVNQNIIPTGNNIMGLDIGVGANCIYPILGNAEYDWSFVATDIDANALENCVSIIEKNPHLNEVISLQQQVNSRYIFKDIIQPEDKFAFTICNPPFHDSKEEAAKSAARKVSNLTNQKTVNPILNFGGQNNELWCEGGELAFITQMIYESVKYPKQCFWFTTLVSKKDHLKSIYKTLNKVEASTIRTIEMNQGQKISRLVAWTFLSENQQKEWKFTSE
ncbi:MAG TPA: 23S rRNA (adenine(1618)-N(6))-methyltransferase RlmF [Flavobacterium sp.]|uniref:23S rRNA (adenine(1618)-N(6))-methyltransferase RlmF n=1 Tax=unclassified Flavobacterium TaxID=196869 RepID=UPI000E8002CB|nr:MULTISPECIES: 23S rRNA (adenine(1618)-N(6))-methyltransferase RlmF [unclassified Flavobacterium]HBI00526.1 23S rRNA (adenine(1618)-N(6))-methyltransferase RlmF [Flavobacterium sp.]HRE76668.1 23S rRNA (adenine(1618)-N(6))-methyltransferase RlmF [Flavobacterium sp.]